MIAQVASADAGSTWVPMLADTFEHFRILLHLSQVPMIPRPTRRAGMLIEHPLTEHLVSGDATARSWATFAEGLAPMIYSVPAFLGLTLGRATDGAREVLEDIWREELGDGPGLVPHPVLFQRFHREATRGCQRTEEMERVSRRCTELANHMVALCASGPWHVGVAAMRAHESQFPALYPRFVPSARERFGDAAAFFEVHAQADVEHCRAQAGLLEEAIRQGEATEAELSAVSSRSAHLLAGIFDAVHVAIERAPFEGHDA